MEVVELDQAVKDDGITRHDWYRLGPKCRSHFTLAVRLLAAQWFAFSRLLLSGGGCLGWHPNSSHHSPQLVQQEHVETPYADKDSYPLHEQSWLRVRQVDEMDVLLSYSVRTNCEEEQRKGNNDENIHIERGSTSIGLPFSLWYRFTPDLNVTVTLPNILRLPHKPWSFSPYKSENKAQASLFPKLAGAGSRHHWK